MGLTSGPVGRSLRKIVRLTHLKDVASILGMMRQSTSRGAQMNAADVMVPDVVTVAPQATVREVAALLVKHRVSAVPVVDPSGRIVGIVSEGDLMWRAETGTERRRSWWLQAFSGNDLAAEDFRKANARRVSDLMTTKNGGRTRYPCPAARNGNLSRLSLR
jgi:CBS-domain-containing membrane protein